MSSLETVSSPAIQDESRGSSASSRLQEEYEEMLRYAVVTPNWDPKRKSPLSNQNVMLKDRHITIHQDDDDDDDDDEDEEDESTSKEFLSDAAPTPRREILPLETEGVSPASTEEKRDDDIDEDLAKLDLQLDAWTLDLKRNVLAEFGHTKIRILERHRREMERERERHAAQMSQLQNELESAKELLVTYEESIARKDTVLANLTKAVQKQRERLELQKNFSAWKIHHCDEQREEFASKLARRHYWRTVGLKIWKAWHGVLEAKWRQRVEKACQAKAEEVCHKISCDYEEQIAQLKKDLGEANTEVGHLRKEREKYEETMKRAFMRGVCALNLEAMTMFRERAPKDDDSEEQQDNNADGWIPQNPVHVLLESGQTSSAAAAAESRTAVSRGAKSRGRAHVVQTSAKGRSVFVEKHDGGGDDGAIARHDKVPAARIGAPARGKTHRLPTVKVVQ